MVEIDRSAGGAAFTPAADGPLPDGTSPIALLLRTLERRDALNEGERRALDGAWSDTRVYPQGTALLRAHVPADHSSLLLDGLVGRVTHGVEGDRQIVALHVAGDFIDLHSFVLGALDHDLVALSDAKVALFPHAALRQLTERQPHLTRLLWLMTAIDAAVHRQWIARQSHSAAVRVAHLLCEMQARFAIVRIGTPEGFPLPLTQADIGDATGLTPVHVNRTLRKLRESRLAVVRSGYVSIPDVDAIRAFARFDPAYLYLQSRPR